jgi:hypothetical protein
MIAFLIPRQSRSAIAVRSALTAALKGVVETVTDHFPLAEAFAFAVAPGTFRLVAFVDENATAIATPASRRWCPKRRSHWHPGSAATTSTS